MKKTLIASCIAGLSLSSHASLMITGVVDGPLSGGVPKAVELYAYENITDLSQFGLGTANNGGGSDGEEFSFPAQSVAAGAYLYVSLDDSGFDQFFGFTPDFISAALSINGDDAIELFNSGQVVDIFGDIHQDGTGQTWDYLDGWAYRKTGATASAVFSATDWYYSGANALDGAANNASASSPFPLKTFAGDGGDNGGGDGGDGGGVDGETLVPISSIQGTPETQLENSYGETDVSPMIGQRVYIQAIVVGDFQTANEDSSRNLQGFYVQEESADEDGDPQSSEGLFIYQPLNNYQVEVGDRVDIIGTVDQYFGETQLSYIEYLHVLETDQLASVTPAEISLSDNSAVSLTGNGAYQADLEAYEGMWVRFSDSMTISEQYQLDRFNEIRLIAGSRPYQYTHLSTPNPEGYDQHLRNIAAHSVVYDDGLNLQNQSIGGLDGFEDYSEFSAKRMGDTIDGLSGIVDYKWAGDSASGNTWRIRSVAEGSNIFTSNAEGNSPNPRPDSAPEVGGDIKIASFNVLNFFHTIDLSGASTLAGHDPRGADSQAEFERQLDKLSNALTQLNADVIGLVELENEFDAVNDNSTAIEILVNAVNDRIGEPRYAYVYPGTTFVGSDAIAVGIIYRQDTIELAADSHPALLDDSVAAQLDVFSSHDFESDPIFDGKATNRVSLAASFTSITKGETFTVVANHFKSKGSSDLEDTTSPNYDKRDGAAFWNQRRLNAATAVVAWLDTAPTGVADDDVVILGDLNAYAMEDPIQYLIANGFNNVESGDSYSYVFDGQIGTLDYMLVSDSLSQSLTDAAIWNINADEADAIDYNLDYGRDELYFNGFSALRSSDHDPVIAGFSFEVPPSIHPVDKLIEALQNGLENDSLQGTGVLPVVRQHREQRVLADLQSTFALFSAGEAVQACEQLHATELQVDGRWLPRDLLKGSGRAAFAAQIASAMLELECQLSLPSLR